MSRDPNLDDAPKELGLRVTLGVKPTDDVREAVAIRVAANFRVPTVRDRHVITVVRVIDADRRWGGAAIIQRLPPA